jgi:DNA-binding Lrp family transcriptional regulator
MLHRYYSTGERFFSQKELAENCNLSLGTVNPLIKKLERMRIVECRPLGLRLLDPKRALLYWAAERDFFRDVIYSTFTPDNVSEVEATVRGVGLLTAHSGYKLLFGKVPLEYSNVFVYARVEEIKEKYGPREGPSNLFVLRIDDHLKRISEEGAVPLVQLYVDLWQLGELRGELLEEIEKKLASAPLRALERVT